MDAHSRECDGECRLRRNVFAAPSVRWRRFGGGKGRGKLGASLLGQSYEGRGRTENGLEQAYFAKASKSSNAPATIGLLAETNACAVEMWSDGE